MSEAFTESWYRLFLRAFPSGHRAEYGAEILGTLMNDSPRRVPSPRETAALVTAGFAARARKAAEGPAPWWADGLHLGLLTLALANLSYNIADHASPWWLAASAALVVALLRGWALAAAIYVLPGLASALTNPPASLRYTAYWATLAALLLIMAATGWRRAAKD
ncbi:hypothetical protein [Nonomuraea sp. NPDC049028]|uniref:hypothetical protein n=1 Tax=Nonomuraea sp. NPDC049028 TaxID=3364348 RepID=UPI003714923D